VDLYKIVHTRANDTLQSTELSKQFTPLLWTKSRDLLQPRGISCFGASLTMPRNGETVRFVPNLLYQKQGR
jgi:hypothetical protein